MRSWVVQCGHSLPHPRVLFAGYVVTLTGRRRYLPDITHADEQKRLYAERQAVNSVIQGTARCEGANAACR